MELKEFVSETFRGNIVTAIIGGLSGAVFGAIAGWVAANFHLVIK